MTLPSCLIVESLEVGDEQVAANLRIGSRHERVVIGYAIPNLLEYKKMVSALDRPQRAKRALFDVMTRAYRGEPVSLPLDLSYTVRDVDEAWPLRATIAASDAPLDLSVTTIEHDTPESGVTTVHMRVLGVTTVVIVDNRGRNDNQFTLFRFVSGVHPWQLTDAEADAMLAALAKAVKTGVIA